MAGGFKMLKNGLEKYQKDLLSRQSMMKALFNGPIYKLYQVAQQRRWMTENMSEGNRWKPLSSEYKISKKKRFATYEGGGTKTMIATGKLVNAATGKDKGNLNKIITDTTMTLTLNKGRIPYAEEASKVRPTMVFGKETKEVFKDAIREFIKTGKAPGGVG